MYYPPVRLECDGLTTLILNTNGLNITQLDLGDAETRTVVEEAPDADGTDDTTTYTGARSVAMALRLDGTTWAARQALRSFMHPRQRPTLIFQLADDAPEQQVTLRRGQFSDPIPAAHLIAQQFDVVCQWVAPYGIIESSEEHTGTAYAAGTVTAGRAYSLTYPRVYPASEALGSVTLTNAGTADAYPVIRLYGPMTEPVFDNDTQGKSLAFTGLTILAGEYVEIDTRAKTIYFNGDSTNSRYDTLDFPTSEWWTLSPGSNQLRLHPATFTEATALAQVIWRDAWL